MVDETMHSIVIRVTATELAKMHQLAGTLREPIAVVMRRWIRDFYQARFGDAKPDAPTLKHGGKLKMAK